jgi:hypothetical protein
MISSILSKQLSFDLTGLVMRKKLLTHNIMRTLTIMKKCEREEAELSKVKPVVRLVRAVSNAASNSENEFIGSLNKRGKR